VSGRSPAPRRATSRLIEIPCVAESRGSLSFVEAERHVPFAIKRVYWVYGVPPGERRGCHAHRSVQEVVLAVAGSVLVHCDDGNERETFALDDPARGLLLDCGVWRELDSFSPGAVCLVLASEEYAEDEYVRDYAAFAAAAGRSR
jgi:hypothetical protein